jgi:raffinose/stachyose/melibiose transport system substrate-binding protein
VHIGGKDNWTVGNFFDWVAPSIFVTDENNYQGDALKAGTFDTATWVKAAELMKVLKDREYLNVDVLTSTYPDSASALGSGASAFEFFGNYVIAEALTYNPDANLGFFPVPAYYEGDEPSLISGERTAIGIWKDSKHAEEAKLLLSFLARPEVMAPVATANGIPAGLVTATSDTGSLSDSYEQWKSVEAFPYFDREYLPSGMWDTMCSTGTGVLSEEMTTAEAADKMLEDFTKLYK